MDIHQDGFCNTRYMRNTFLICYIVEGLDQALILFYLVVL